MTHYIISFSVKNELTPVRYFVGFGKDGINYSADVFCSFWFSSQDDADMYLTLLRLTPFYQNNDFILDSKVSSLTIELK